MLTTAFVDDLVLNPVVNIPDACLKWCKHPTEHAVLDVQQPLKNDAERMHAELDEVSDCHGWLHNYCRFEARAALLDISLIVFQPRYSCLLVLLMRAAIDQPQ